MPKYIQKKKKKIKLNVNKIKRQKIIQLKF